MTNIIENTRYIVVLFLGSELLYMQHSAVYIWLSQAKEQKENLHIVLTCSLWKQFVVHVILMPVILNLKF